MDIPVTVPIPYRFGIQLFNTSPATVQSWPVIGDPALLGTGI